MKNCNPFLLTETKGTKVFNVLFNNCGKSLRKEMYRKYLNCCHNNNIRKARIFFADTHSLSLIFKKENVIRLIRSDVKVAGMFSGVNERCVFALPSPDENITISKIKRFNSIGFACIHP